MLTKVPFCYRIFFASGCSSVWYERYVGDVEAAGSNPVTPTIYKNLQIGIKVSRFFYFKLAQQLKVHVGTLLRWIREGKMPAVRL